MNNLILDDFEQDLVLACKGWYGNKGIEKVIAKNIGDDLSNITLGTTYYWIEKLFLKLCENNFLNIKTLLDDLSFDRVSLTKYEVQLNGIKNIPMQILKKMISMIKFLKVREKDNNGKCYYLIFIHNINKDFV